VQDQIEIAVGANNVFDVYPSKIPTGRNVEEARNYPATNYVVPYSQFSPFGFNGRFLYLRGSVRF
jgi:iron complex outermembrane receptor protein